MDTYNQLLGKIRANYKGDNPAIKKALAPVKPKAKAKSNVVPKKAISGPANARSRGALSSVPIPTARTSEAVQNTAKNAAAARSRGISSAKPKSIVPVASPVAKQATTTVPTFGGFRKTEDAVQKNKINLVPHRQITTPTGKQVQQNARQKHRDVTAAGMKQAFKDNAGARAVAGFHKGISLFPFESGISKTYGSDTLEALQKSKAYKAGEFAGIAAQYGIPYTGAAKALSGVKAVEKAGGEIGKTLAFNIPKISAETAGKIGQSAARNLAADLAVGVPLDLHNLGVKDNLRGSDLANSMAINTAMNIGIGGAIEAAPLLKGLVRNKPAAAVLAPDGKVKYTGADNLIPKVKKQSAIVPTSEQRAMLQINQNHNSGIRPSATLDAQGPEQTSLTGDRPASFINNISSNPQNVNKFENSIVPEKPRQTKADVVVPRQEDEATIAKVLTSTDPGKRSAKNFVSDAYGQVKRKFVDSGDTVAKIAKITKDDALYPLYNNAKQAWRRGEHMIGVAQTDLRGNQVGKSLKEIFKPVLDKGDDYYRKFQEYAYHMHNIDRMSIVSKAEKTLLNFEAKHQELMGIDYEDLVKIAKENEAAREYVSLIDNFNKAKDKPVFGDSVTADISREEAQRLLKENPEFAKYAEEIYKFNRNNMNYRVEAGLLTKEQADLMMEMYPHYVPTFRAPAGSKGMTAKENVAKIGKTIKAATGSDKDLMPLHESIARQTMQVAESANKNIFANRLANNSRPETSKFIQDIKALDEMFDIDTDLSALPELKNHFTFYKDGKAYSVRADNSLYEGLKALAPNKDPNALMDVATAVNTGFKQLITSWSPVFLIRNGARDLQDVGLYSKNLVKFVQKYPTAWKEMTTDGDLWQQYKALGGIGSSFFDYAKGFKEDSSWLKKNTLDRIESLNVAIEQLPRFAEFIASVEKNGASYDGLMKAMYDAADVTVNFGRSGTWGKTINSTFVPFFNPAIQGTSKLIRRFTENKSAKDWTVLAIRAAALGVAPSLLNELLYTNDPQYNDIPDRERDINYIFKIGDNEWVKIPKGRVISLFGSPGQRIVRAKNGEGINHMDWLKTMVDQVGPISPFESNIASPIAAVKTNRTWYGTPIEPKRLESFSPGKRADERTTTFARALGEKLGYSPKKIDYLIDAYTGVIGDIAIPAMTPSAERNMISKAFKIDSVMTNKTPQMFYDKVDEVNWAKNDTGAYKYDAMSRYLNKQGGLVSDISSQMREIDGSLTDNKTKREKLREMREASNGIQKMALESLPRVEKAAERLSNKYDDPDDLYREVNRDVFGAEYALKTYDKDVYKKASETVGGKLSYDIYYDAYFSLKDVYSDKGKDGKSVVAGSTAERSGQGQSASAKKRKYIDTISNLTVQERIKLYDAFEVAKSVREYRIIVPTKK